MQTNREWKIQDGGHRTEIIYISASGRYSKDILMAIGLPMFMGSSTPIALRKSLCKKRKWKVIQDGGHVFKQRYEYFCFRVAAILHFHFRFCRTAFSVFPKDGWTSKILSLGGIEAEINRSKVKLRLPVAQERLSVRTWCISRVRIEYYYVGSLPPPVRQDSLAVQTCQILFFVLAFLHSQNG